MIVRIALKMPNNIIVYKNYIGVTASVSPDSHLLQIFYNKQVIAEFKSDHYVFWEYTSMPQQAISRAKVLLLQHHEA
jgi:hypothetical protein